MTRVPKPTNSAGSFEEALHRNAHELYVLKLYVAGTTPNSLRAVANLRAVCQELLEGRYELEVIDIYQQPQHAKQEHIVVVPTLIKKLPLPVRKIIGDLSNKQRLLVGLDIVQRPIPG